MTATHRAAAVVIDRAEAIDAKGRGAFFTPPEIAEFLAAWAIADDPAAKILDPTCGDGAFLVAAATRLGALGAPTQPDQLVGIDIDAPSLASAEKAMRATAWRPTLFQQDFLGRPAPDSLFENGNYFDAVIGNPPYVRYQRFSGDARTTGLAAALSHGVRLSGLTSSWAPILVHSAAFLADRGRLAMVLPAELLTVGYAEPIRRWLLRRFATVKLVLFERLQFSGVQEDVVLLLARGSGGCDAFSLYYVDDASELKDIRAFDEWAVGMSAEGKWTDLLLPLAQRKLFQRVAQEAFSPLSTVARVELGTVTGHNGFFALNESVRRQYGMRAGVDVHPLVPAGTRYLSGLQFSKRDWQRMQESDLPVWLLAPTTDVPSPELAAYLEVGKQLGVPDTYKSRSRQTWWRPPMVRPPDLLFTYMSHRFPRMFVNSARATLLNSMHAVHIGQQQPPWLRNILPLAMFNSLTMLGGELKGRAYGGGVLKLEPREAGALPLPRVEALAELKDRLRPQRSPLVRQLRAGRWTSVLATVDKALFVDVLGMPAREASELHEAARSLRTRRLGRAREDRAAHGR